MGAYCAAGERADDRWLREEGLWTPRRAVCTEVGAQGDRQTLLAFSPHVGFGDKEVHYRAIHDLADEVIEEYWVQITTLAAVLVERIRLDGNEIASLAELEGGACGCTQGAPLRPDQDSWWRRLLRAAKPTA
jgi:hypothetical protein